MVRKKYTFQRVLYALVVAAVVTLGLSVQRAMAQTYTIGIVPQFDSRQLSATWTPIIDYLESETGYEFTFVGSPRIPEFEVAFKNGEFDFAYMNPYHVLRAAEAQGYQPLVRDGGRKLYGVLVVQKDGPIQDMSDLNGGQIAFPAPNALGASLMMRALLVREHGLEFQSVFVSTHTSAYMNVALGQADAAGGVQSTLNQLAPEVRERLRIIYETPKVEPHPVVAHPRVPDAVRDAVRDAFLKLGQSEEGLALLAPVPMKMPVPATYNDYLPLSVMGLEVFYVKSGL